MSFDFNKVKQTALANARTLVEKWFPGGRFRGNEYVVRNPKRDDRHIGSFSINTETGRWGDFATDDKGKDLVSLYMFLNDIHSWPEAVNQLGQELGIEGTASSRKKEKAIKQLLWAHIIPVPSNAPSVSFKHPKYGLPSNTWEYRDEKGLLLHYICRFDPQKGRKQILPRAFYSDGKGNRSWQWKAPQGLRPLYGLELLASAAPDKMVLLAEGEKAADAAREMLGEDLVVMTWSGGSNAVTKTDWTPLAERDVIIAPDADKPGYEAALKISAVLQGKSVHMAIPPKDAPKGWDLADADDWDREKILSWIEESKLAPKAFKVHASERFGIQEQHTVVAEAMELGFTLTDKGVVYHGLTNKGDLEEVWVCSHLEILAATHDENNENWGILCRVKDPDGNLHSFAMPMEWTVSKGNEFLTALVSRGLKVGTDRKSKKLLLDYLTQSSPEQRVLSVNRTGWHDDRFVLHDKSYGPADGLQAILQGHFSDNPYRCRGGLEDWKASVGRLAVGNTRLIFAICTAFAAPLLRLVGMESGGFNFVGSSSIGKTTILLAAGSVCGGGGLSGYIKPWRATGNGLEALAASHCDMLLALDELSQCSSKDIAEAAYMFANGMGKARAMKTGAGAPIQQWRLNCLSSSEMTFEQKLNEDRIKPMAGQVVRFVDIPADAGCGLGAFEYLHGFKDGDAFANAIRNATSKYYGPPLRGFLEKVTQDKELIHVRLSELMTVFCQAYLPEEADGQVKRVCKRMALVAAAGELASELGILPWESGASSKAVSACFKNWIDSRGGTESSEVYAAIQQVRAFIEKHGSSRFELIGEDVHPENRLKPKVEVRDRVGFRRMNQVGELEYYVLGEAFRKELCAGYNPQMVCHELRKRGMMLEQPGSKGYQVNQVLPGFGQKKVYGLKSKVLEA